MINYSSKRALGAAMVAAVVLASQPSRADVADYEFQLVDKVVRKDSATVAVRLVKKTSGEPVADAVIFSTRLDMAPDKMEMMTAPVEALPSTEAGIYRFKLSPSMPGGWCLSLGAKLQGETGTLKADVALKVEP